MADRTLRNAERSGDLARVLGTRLRQETISYPAVELLAWTHYGPAREVLGWPEGRFPNKVFAPLNHPPRLCPPYVAYPAFRGWVGRLPGLGLHSFLHHGLRVKTMQWVLAEITFRIAELVKTYHQGWIWDLAYSRVNAWLRDPTEENAMAARSSWAIHSDQLEPAWTRIILNALWLVNNSQVPGRERTQRLLSSAFTATIDVPGDSKTSVLLDLSRLHTKILEVCGTA